MSLIELQDISKSYKGMALFTDVNMKLEEGKIYGLIGHNGSGKSVLFKIICGFIQPDSGRVVIDRRFKKENAMFPSDFGIIIDRPGYIANKTGFQNLKMLANIQKKITDQEIHSAMKLVGLQPAYEEKMRNYSLGMKQKIAIAQAIMENQQVLLLDEAFNGLDRTTVEKLRNLLLDFKKEGKTIFITSHNNEDIQAVCDEVFEINEEKITKV